jgi:hypothetical protein
MALTGIVGWNLYRLTTGAVATGPTKVSSTKTPPKAEPADDSETVLNYMGVNVAGTVPDGWELSRDCGDDLVFIVPTGQQIKCQTDTPSGVIAVKLSEAQAADEYDSCVNEAQTKQQLKAQSGTITSFDCTVETIGTRGAYRVVMKDSGIGIGGPGTHYGHTLRVSGHTLSLAYTHADDDTASYVARFDEFARSLVVTSP